MPPRQRFPLTALTVATAVTALACLLSGCAAVGPNYGGAPATQAQARFARAGDSPVGIPLDDWWTALGDPHIDSLVQRALAANPTVAVAAARLRRARASLRMEHENQAPKASVSALAAHARLPPLDLGSLTGSSSSSESGSSSGAGATNINLYSLGFDATWEIDLFGGQRRAIEAAVASASAAEDKLADAQVSLTAEVVQAYVKLRDTQARMALNEGSIARQERMLALTGQRVERGTAGRLELVRLQGQLESTRANAIPLGAQRDAYLNELATLVGSAPGALDAELAEVTPVPLPPAQVAIGDPSEMLQRRPDVRAAERTLAARTAQIGQAEAARFPKLSLLGLIGLGGTSPSDLTHLDDFTAILAPQLSWNFLDFGRAKTKVTQAEADRDEAEAQYQDAVNTALRDAEDALSRYRNRRITVATIARAKASADQSAELMRQKNAAGTASLIDLLDTERQQISAEQNLSEARAGLTTDFVSLQKALGLGWSARVPPG